MNIFDVVVITAMAVAIILGFNAGLLRSLATILAWLIAAPIAVAITPRLTTLIRGQTMSTDQTSLVLGVALIAIALILSAVLRAAVSEFVGPDISLFDRLAGAMLGALRIGLIVVLIVVIFDRLIPNDRQPQFLADSRLRPYLSAAGKAGLQSLSPEIDGYVDQLRRERGI